jgi:hypothetical protein
MTSSNGFAKTTLHFFSETTISSFSGCAPLFSHGVSPLYVAVELQPVNHTALPEHKGRDDFFAQQGFDLPGRRAQVFGGILNTHQAGDNDRRQGPARIFGDRQNGDVLCLGRHGPPGQSPLLSTLACSVRISSGPVPVLCISACAFKTVCLA